MSVTKIIAFATALALIVLAYLTWQERIIFTDAAFHLFYTLANDETPVKSRFIGELIHGLPLWLSRWRVDLELIAPLYSVWIGVFVLLVSAATRRIDYVLVVLLSLVLITRHCYYWPVSELPVSVTMSMMYIAWLRVHDSGWRRVVRLLSLAVISVTIAFAHPLGVAFFLFAIVYEWRRGAISMTISSWSGLFFVCAFVVKTLSFSSHDDGGKIERLSQISVLATNYFNSLSMTDLLVAMETYHVSFVVWLACSIVLIKKRHWDRVLMFVGATIVYLFLINILFSHNSEQFYIENMYYPIAGMMALVFIAEVLPMLTIHRRNALLSVLFILSIWQIYQTRDPYAERIDWLANEMEVGRDKLIVPQSSIPMDTVMMTWGTSYESWLLSTLRSGESRFYMIDERVDQYHWATGATDVFVGKWGSYPYSELNSLYFKFNMNMGYCIDDHMCPEH